MQALTVFAANKYFDSHHQKRTLLFMDAGPCYRSGRMGARGLLLSSQITFNVFKGSIPEFVAAEEDALNALDALVVAVVREF